jgi:hypothetical protein
MSSTINKDLLLSPSSLGAKLSLQEQHERDANLARNMQLKFVNLILFAAGKEVLIAIDQSGLR